ncbi:MAG: hypothetical protein LUQ31_07170 [Methanoregula sp.]|nr:hypothetical protein [Methanoregula sp.]
MTHNNPWFLITSDEINKIREQMRSLESTEPGHVRDSCSTIGNILDTVEHRLS